MEKNIKVLIKRPGGTFERQIIKNDLDTLQKIVGGHIEVIQISETVLAVMDAEGKIKGKAPNFVLRDDMIVGTVVFAGLEGEDFRSLTEEEAIRTVEDIIWNR